MPGILVAGALLVAGGLFASRRDSRWLAVALVTLGALTVGTIFFWTVFATILALTLIVLFVIDTRRTSPTAERPAI